MPDKVPQLGKVQYRIMQVLWRSGKATAREITDELSQERPIAHSTVQTLLRQLEGKGVVSHDPEERTFVYRPLCDQANLTGTPLRELLQRVYRGSVVNLMSHLLKQEEVSADELSQLRAMIDEEVRK